MRIRGIGRLRQYGKKLWLKTQPRALILLYHRITEIDFDPQLLCVVPQNFNEHLQILKHSYNPISLQELSRNLLEGQVPHRAVVITYDDGYADSLYQAKPLLEQHGIPATVFVSTGSIGQFQEFWWDDLERVLLQPGNVPERLSLTVNGNNYSWEFGASRLYNDSDYQNYCSWNILALEEPTARHEIYRVLHRLMLLLTPKHQQEILRKLVVWAGIDSAGRKTHRVLTSEEVRQLSSKGFVEVGAHCRTHPVLSAISKESQQEEIQQSKRELELLLGQPIKSFAYPYGTRSDYTRETVMIVQKTGFTCACSNFADVVLRGTDRFQLPRYAVRNWTGQEFARRLQEWFYD